MSGAVGAFTGGGGAGVRVGITINLQNQQAIQGLNQLQAAIGNLRNDFSGLEISLRSLDRILTYIAVGSAAHAASSFVKMASELERLTVLLSTLEGSMAGANTRMDQLIAIAGKAPFSLKAITDAFIKLKVAGIEPITGAGGEGPLQALLDGLAAFGATDQQLNRMATAMQQMAGKGVVSLEELRQQMGDSMPTAMRLMAEGLGMTTARLIEEISRGNITAERGLTALIDKMREKYSGMSELLTNTVSGAFRQLTTEINRTAVEAQRAGFLDVLTTGIRALTDQFRQLNDVIRDNGGGALESFFAFIGANSDQVSRFVTTINAFGIAVGALITGVMGIVNELPAEAIAGGIIGYIFFGRAGAVAGVLAGMVSEVVVVLAQLLASIIQMLGNLASFLGLEINQFVTMGLLGAILFGRFGVFAVVAVGIADQIIAGLRARIANFIATAVGWYEQIKTLFSTGSFSEAFAAGAAGRQSFLDRNASQPNQTFGNINLTPLQELMGSAGAASNVNAAQVRDFATRMQEAVAAVRAAREQFAGRAGQPNDLAGLNQQEIDKVEELTKAYERMQDRLASLNGREIDGYLSQQRRRLEQFRGVIASVEERAKQAEAAGRTAEAGQLRAQLSDLTAQANAFQNIIDKVKAADVSRIGDRAGIAIGRYGNQLNQIREQLEAAMAEFTGGKRSENAEVERVEARFATTARQLANLRLQTQALRGSEEERSATLATITELEQKLIEVRAKGIEIARRRAAREQEDSQRDASRRVEDLATALTREDLNRNANPFNNNAIDILNRSEQYRGVIRQIDDSLLELKRKLEDNPTNTWISERIAQLEEMRERYRQFYSEVGSFQEQEARRSKELWKDVASSVQDALGRGLEVLITKSGTLKDVMNDLFRSISRSVSKYLTDLAFQQIGGALGGGNAGGGIFSLLKLGGNLLAGSFGGIDGGLKSAMGNVFNNGTFQRFAGGGAFTNGIVSGPTLFNIGQMGEAGPEAIMPLTRVGGKLGVQATGGGSINNFHISAVDAASVRELFYREGSAIVDAINSRTRMNRGMR